MKAAISANHFLTFYYFFKKNLSSVVCIFLSEIIGLCLKPQSVIDSHCSSSVLHRWLVYVLIYMVENSFFFFFKSENDRLFLKHSKT